MAEYPIPMFHFMVEWRGTKIGFSEVSGLTIETQPIEYRDDSTPGFSARKMPGKSKYSTITFKRGITKTDNDFFKWLGTRSMDKTERRNLIISLLNEQHEPAMKWKVINAFPVKMEGLGFKASGNEAAIESIEIAHEGVSIVND